MRINVRNFTGSGKKDPTQQQQQQHQNYQHYAKPEEPTHTTVLINEDKKSKKRNLLEVISFKKSPSIPPKDIKKHHHSPAKIERPLEPVEIAHLETLKV